MKNKLFEKYKIQIIENRKLINGTGISLLSELIELIESKPNKELFSVLFYSLYDESEYDEIIYTVTRVICNYIRDENNEWAIQETLDSSEIIMPHGLFNYSIVFLYLMNENFEKTKNLLIKSNISTQTNILRVIEFTKNNDTFKKAITKEKSQLYDEIKMYCKYQKR